MKTQELIVSCFYSNDGGSIQNLLFSLFFSFLNRELQKFAQGPDHHISYL